jgi:hypothetical protein
MSVLPVFAGLGLLLWLQPQAMLGGFLPTNTPEHVAWAGGYLALCINYIGSLMIAALQIMTLFLGMTLRLAALGARALEVAAAHSRIADQPFTAIGVVAGVLLAVTT